MIHEALVNGGHLVKLNSGSLAVEGVPDACRGRVVQSAVSHVDGTDRVAGQYSLTRRVSAGVDLWHVRRVETAEPARARDTSDRVEARVSLYDSDTSDRVDADELEISRAECDALVQESIDCPQTVGHVMTSNGRSVFAL